MPKSHIILASLLIAASAAAPSGVYIPSAGSSNSIQNTQSQSQSRFKSVRAESSPEKAVNSGRPGKKGRYHTHDGKIRKSHKKRIPYWGVPVWDGMNPLNALANPWTYKRNHSPSHHSPRFRSPKFGKRSPIPVGGTSPQLPLPAEPISALPPLLPNGPSSLTSPLDGLGGLPSIITNANATVVDGGSGSVPLMGGLNGGVTIGTIVGKRKRSHSDAPPQRVTETSHERVESGSGLGLDVGLELGLGLGGYQEDDRTYTYEHYNPHDNTGNDNGLGTKHPHAHPAAPPSAKPTKNNRPKPNHGDTDIHEDIHKHIHEHIHNSKRDDGAGGVPGTVDIVSMQNNTRLASLMLDIGTANGTSGNGNTTEKVFVLNASETNRTTVYLVADSDSSFSAQPPATHGSGVPSPANHTTPATLQIPVFDTGRAEMVRYCMTFDPSSQPSPLTLDPCQAPNNTDTQGKSQAFEYWSGSGVVRPFWMGSNTSSSAAPSNSTGGGALDVELVFMAGTPEVRPIEQDPSTSTVATTTTSVTSAMTTSVAPSVTAAAAMTTSAAASSVTPSSVVTSSSSSMSSAAAATTPAAAVIGLESASLDSTSTASDTSDTTMTGSATSTSASTMTTTMTNVSVTAEDAESTSSPTPVNDAQADSTSTITPAPTMTTYNPDPSNTARTPITINESEANAAHESANRAHTHIRPNTYTLGPLQSFDNIENGYSASARLPLGRTTETVTHTSTSTGGASAATSAVAADGYSASAFVPLGRSTKTATHYHTSTDTSVTGTASAISTVAAEGYSASAFVPLGRSTKTVTHWHTSTTPSGTGTGTASASESESATVAGVEASGGPATGTGWARWGSSSAAPSASASTSDQDNDAADPAPTDSATDSDPDSAPYDNPAGASSTWDEWSAGSSAPTAVAAAGDGPDSKPTTWAPSSSDVAPALSSSSVTVKDFNPNPGPWPTPSATPAVGPNPDFVDALTAKSGSTDAATSTLDDSPAATIIRDIKGDPGPWPTSSMSDSAWPSPSDSASTGANDASNPTSTFSDTEPSSTGVPPSSADPNAEAVASMIAGNIEDNSAKDNSGTFWTRWIGKDKQ